jgi:hypothetical protein
MRNNYIEVLSNKVEIPIIQRDYAQGRTDDKTNRIRKDFLDVIFEFIQHKYSQASNAEIELDFIYGFNEQDTAKQTTFIPIDGQQRLTTLWLLYWFVAAKENIPKQESSFLSNFIYETRHSTTEFCKRLIQYEPDFSGVTIREELKNQAWYFETWDFDPSIQAMLIVLNDIEERYNNANISSVWSVIGHGGCPFYFYKLDMNKVGLTDDLYIKMNSRGKALTEFEYFKAGFSELITEPTEKERFEKSIDGEWIDAVWNIVFESNDLADDDDIALIVDNSFLNLFNFITSVIAFKKDITTVNNIRYKDTVASADLVQKIYGDSENQNILFYTLDAVCRQQENDHLFWNNSFYFAKGDFVSAKTRLYFQHKEVCLLRQCLFHFSENRGLSFPEQILLHACFTQLIIHSKDFESQIRSIRNLAVNSENELRDTILGSCFIEVEQFIQKGDLNIFKSFNTDQIEAEKRKKQFSTSSIALTNIIREIEDSDIFRGSISLFPLDTNFKDRAEKFLSIFDENEISTDFNEKCNLLLSFGDYSQDDGNSTNLLSANKAIIRSFFTTPGYNKKQFYNKTQKVVMSCLDYFIANPTDAVANKIEETITYYNTNPKDWKYYFMKYPSFRESCPRGYYIWYDAGDFCIWKMYAKDFRGRHWDPFIYEVKRSILPQKLSLEAYGAKLLLTLNRKKLLVSSKLNGFLFENGMSANTSNTLMDDLIGNGSINNLGELIVPQNNEGADLVDRIEVLKNLLMSLLD